MHLRFVREEVTSKNKLVNKNDYRCLSSVNKLYVNLSKHLNLAVIRGDLTGERHKNKFVELAKNINSHFIDANLLNIYINLESYDIKGMSYLLSLCPIINEELKKDNYITVYWNTMQNEAVTKVAGYFGEKLACDLQICDI